MTPMNNPHSGGRVPQTTACKCCAQTAQLTGVVDFSKCGRDWLAGRKVEPYVGWPVYYYHCAQCGFVFTRAFDHWTTEDFARHIYNDDYVNHDPDYLDARPRANAQFISETFGDDRANTTVLDYGSGAGFLGGFLAAAGFPPVVSYDPFSSPARPEGTFRMITCFEVFEHTPDPKGLLSDIASYLAEDGAVLFSTLICSTETVDQGIANWWYCNPRNGHISFYARETLMRLAAEAGLSHGWFDEWRHVFYRDRKPAWLKRYVAD